jgi:hypothetical protein
MKADAVRRTIPAAEVPDLVNTGKAEETDWDAKKYARAIKLGDKTYRRSMWSGDFEAED